MALRRFLVPVLVFLIGVPLAAQTVTGVLQGTVTDKSGGALPGVSISVRNHETGLERVTVTNEKGFYSAPFLPVGKYRVTAELAGLGSSTHNNVGVELNTTTVRNFELAPQLSETVTVNAEAPHINLSDAEIKQTMTATEIMERPNANPGNFLDLASVFAGFDENPTSGQNNPTASSGSSINFNGTGTRGATFQINGVNNDDSSENQNRQGVALATVKSFQVISNNYSAEFGRGYGAVVLVQTKSGTNNLEGEVYDYAQKSRWNNKSLAQRLNNAVKPPAKRDEFGATLGMPILRDRLFGFFAFDKVRNLGANTATRTIIIPSDLTLPRLNLGNDTPANRAFQNDIIARFANGVVNSPVNNRAWVTAADFDFPASDYSGRLDWNARANQSWTARYQRTHQIFQAEDIIPGERADQNNRQSNFGVTWTHILNANTVQEARYGLGLRSTHVYIATGPNTPVIRFTGLPTGTSAPIIGNAGNFPIDRVQRDNQFVYNINSVLWEKHGIRAGVDIRRSSLDDRAENFNRGFWTFTSSCGTPSVTYASPIAALMAGCVTTYQKGYGPAYLQNRLNEENIYAQDDWHATQNLTLNLGLRGEFVDGPQEKEDRIEYDIPDRKYIDPRLGFVYTPEWAGRNRFTQLITGGEGKMSIRGGFGIFHGRVFQSVFSQTGNSVRFNPPYGALLTFSNQTNLSDPTNGFVFTPGTTPNAKISLTTINDDLQMPESHQFNLTFERQIFMQSRLRLSYIGTRARNMLQLIPYNLPVDDPVNGVVVPNHPLNGALAGQTIRRAANFMCAGTTATTTNAQCPTVVPIAANEYSVRTPRVDQRRPDPRYSTNFEISNRGKSWYNGGQIEWESAPMHGFLGRFTYTYSKTIDNGSEATFVGAGDINVFPIGSEGAEEFSRGLSRFDTRHRFTFNGSYQLPFFSQSTGLLKTLLGGWQLATVIKYSSGTPFTIVDGAAFDIIVDGLTNARPVVVDRSILYSHVTRTGQLNSSMFRRAVYGDTLADLAPRNSLYGDGTKNVDALLSKRFALPMGTALVVRLEAYNVFDHVQYSFPNNDFNSATFGTVNTQFNGPRIYQAALRFIY
jgi:hypothetical protein